MKPIADKLVEINITDSNLAASTMPNAPNTGLLSNITDGLVSTPITTIILAALAVAVPLCILAVVLSRLHHNKAKSSKYFKISGILSKATIGFTPIAVILAVIAAPVIHSFAKSGQPLDSTPISITIDKATALSASDVTTTTLSETATERADIFAELDNDFNGFLGKDLTVSAASANNPESAINLSTINTLVHSTPNPVTADDTVDLNVTVSITEDLPVGNYEAKVSFYADYIQAPIEPETATITFWCLAGGGGINTRTDDVKLNGSDEILVDDGYIGKSFTYNVGDSFELLPPGELGLYGKECNEGGSWRNSEKYNDDYSYLYWPGGMFERNPGDLTDIQTVPKQFVGAQPDPSNEPWYDKCWLDYDWAYCNNNEDYQDWMYDIYYPWHDTYVNDWVDWTLNYWDSNQAWPAVDTMEFVWENWPE